MIISEQWLREFVNPEANTDEIAHKITMLGLEVDGIEPAAPAFTGVVVGEIVEIEQHPDADKLRVCQVSNGEESVQVVCGAKNAAKGIRIPFAQVGAKLPGDFKIKKAKLRGVESFGMLCAAAELGLEESSDGLLELPLDAPVGQDIREYLGLDDQLIEVDLTPNRGDCFSMVGVAREVATGTQSALALPEITPVAREIEATFPVKLDALAECPRYAGRVIKNVNASAQTPIWMVERLRRAGVRAINPVVDITNYVMLELGQPMHAFDLSKLNESIVVRKAEEGENLTLLDGNEVSLQSDTLVIADTNKAIALAGIMGGEETSVTDATQDIFLESAFFTPDLIIGKSRKYGLHTDSSHRFERGVDPAIQEAAIERATALIQDIAGGEAGEVTLVHDEHFVPQKEAIHLRAERITRLLGITFDHHDVVDMLQRLGMGVAVLEDGWRVTPPSFRFDINIEADLIEELVRIYGYDNIPRTTASSSPSIKAQPESIKPLDSLKLALVERGYQEVISYSFISPELHSTFSPESEGIALANPISSELGIMRESLIPSLVSTLQYNLNRQQKRARLFESGLNFQGDSENLKQEPMLAGLISGALEAEGWDANTRVVDFFDIKADVESVLSKTGLSQYRFEKSEDPVLHPGQAADIIKVGSDGTSEKVGAVGALHPQLLQKLKIKQKVFVFEVSAAKVMAGSVSKFAALSEFPSSRRDLALVVDESVSAQSIVECIQKSGGETLQEVNIFDIYQGENLKKGSKSVALGLILQGFSSTLSDQDVDASIANILSALEKELGATLRD